MYNLNILLYLFMFLNIINIFSIKHLNEFTRLISYSTIFQLYIYYQITNKYTINVFSA